MTFDKWMNEVDNAISGLTYGMVDSNDLADWHYYDAYEDGATPQEAAREAIKFDGTAGFDY